MSQANTTDNHRSSRRDVYRSLPADRISSGIAAAMAFHWENNELTEQGATK